MKRALSVLLVGVAFGAVACSSNANGGGGAGTSDGGASTHPVTDAATSVNDASTTPAADGATAPPVDSGVRATACTAAPFVAYAATVISLSADGESAPYVGAQIGFSTCQGFELTTDAAGSATTQLTQGIAVTPLYQDQATGAVSVVGAEIPANTDVSVSVALLGAATRAAVPGFVVDGGDTAILEMTLVPDPAATAPCNTTSGVTLSVTGHTEATVSYVSAAWPSDKTVVSTSASADGTLAFVGGVTGASKVQISGTKSGCQVKTVTASQTGNFALLAGSLSVGVATITN